MAAEEPQQPQPEPLGGSDADGTDGAPLTHPHTAAAPWDTPRFSLAPRPRYSREGLHHPGSPRFPERTAPTPKPAPIPPVSPLRTLPGGTPDPPGGAEQPLGTPR